jgi:hypothetical protein
MQGMTLKVCNYVSGLVLILQAALKTACLEKQSAWRIETNSWSTTEEAGHKPQSKKCYIAIILSVGYCMTLPVTTLLASNDTGTDKLEKIWKEMAIA